MGKFDRVHYSYDMLISSEIISEALNKLEIGKSAEPDGVCAESIKFVHHRLHVLHFLFVLMHVSRIVISLNI